jgi:alpha-glucosidase (family GH31 glycosyl hydrolase)
MFSPIAMTFGMDHPGYKEPWNYGEDALRNFRKYDSLRYSLLPYIYSTAWQNHVTGMPLMRALVLNYQDDANVYEAGDQYMFGDNLLVCPVTTKGAQTRTVYLPEGQWFDYWTGKAYKGRQYVHVVTPLDTMPIFAKAGAIIPMQPAMLYCDEKPVTEVTLDIFGGANGAYTLYEDDGKSLEYKQGNYALTQINSSWSAGKVAVQVQKPAGAFKPAFHTYRVKLHMDKKPVTVTENKKSLSQQGVAGDVQQGSWFYNEKEKVLYLATKGNNNSDLLLELGF